MRWSSPGKPSSAAGYNGTWTILSASGDTFTYTNTTSGLPTVTSNSSGYAISANTSSDFTGSQRSMVDSVAYTFNTPVNLTSDAVTLGLQGGVTVHGPAHLATGVANVNWTSLNGGTIWVMTFSSGSGNSVTGHSIADGVYTLSLNNADVTAVSGGSAMTTTRATDTFYRLYGDVIGAQNVNANDVGKLSTSYTLQTGHAHYLACLDYSATGVVNANDVGHFSSRYTSSWSGFTPTI